MRKQHITLLLVGIIINGYATEKIELSYEESLNLDITYRDQDWSGIKRYHKTNHISYNAHVFTNQRPLCRALKYNKSDVVLRLLREKNVDVNYQGDQFWGPPLFTFLYKLRSSDLTPEEIEVFQTLINKKCNINHILNNRNSLGFYSIAH